MMNKLKRFTLMSILAFPLFLFVACSSGSDSEDPGDWYKLSDFEGVTRSDAVSFVIGDEAFVGLGQNSNDYLFDIWGYQSGSDQWSRYDDFPGTGRIGSVAFSADGKGYVLTGYNRDMNDQESGMADFWEFDPEAAAGSQWTQLGDFPGESRYLATGFSIGDFGYITCGYNRNYLKDLWRYNPTTNEWTQMTSVNGSKRRGATAFVINGLAYLAGGDNNGSYPNDFWAYNPSSDSWSNLTKTDDDDDYDEYLLALNRNGAVSFVIDEVGYVVSGGPNSYSNSVFSYDPMINEWSADYTGLEGSSRRLAVGWSFEGDHQGYVATGVAGSNQFEDLWGFDPLAEYDESDYLLQN